MRDIAFENSTFLAQKVDGFLSHLRDGYSGLDTSGLSILSPGLDTGLGKSLSSLLAYNNEGVAPNGVNYYPEDPDAPRRAEFRTRHGSRRIHSGHDFRQRRSSRPAYRRASALHLDF